jgi:hypothetical protein
MLFLLDFSVGELLHFLLNVSQFVARQDWQKRWATLSRL